MCVCVCVWGGVTLFDYQDQTTCLFFMTYLLIVPSQLVTGKGWHQGQQPCWTSESASSTWYLQLWSAIQFSILGLRNYTKYINIYKGICVFLSFVYTKILYIYLFSLIYVKYLNIFKYKYIYIYICFSRIPGRHFVVERGFLHSTSQVGGGKWKIPTSPEPQKHR